MLLSNFTFRCTLKYIVSVAFCSRQILDRKIQFWGEVGVKGTNFAFKLTLRGGRTYGRFSQSQSFLDANVTNTENFLTHGAQLRTLRKLRYWIRIFFLFTDVTSPSPVPWSEYSRRLEQTEKCGFKNIWIRVDEALSWPRLRLYFNVNGGRTRAGHKAPGSEPLIQILPTPMIISFHSVNVIFIHSVEKLIVVRFWHTPVQPNFKLIFVPQVVVWNGKHNSKCWSDVVDVVCDYSFYATWPVPRSFSCAVSQGFT